VVIDGRFRFNPQVTKVCPGVYEVSDAETGLISSIRPCFFRISSIVMLFFSHLSSVDSRRLQVYFNSCTRYVFNLRRYDHLSTQE
jgi:hypothetical protein